jgi:hypothetical protein
MPWTMACGAETAEPAYINNACRSGGSMMQVAFRLMVLSAAAVVLVLLANHHAQHAMF